MSQLNTAPLINPTITETHPNQKMLVKAPAIVHNFCIDDVKMSNDNNYFSITQMDYIKFGQKNKVIQSFQWSSGGPRNLFRLPVDAGLVSSLLPVGELFNTYYNFNSITFSIKPTSNAFVQGLAMVTYINTAYQDGMEMWGIGDIYASDRRLWQIPKKFFISPNSSDEYNFTVPINMPFNFLKWGGTNISHTGVIAYNMGDYRYGFIDITQIVPFETKTDITKIDYVISAQLTDISTSGLKF